MLEFNLKCDGKSREIKFEDLKDGDPGLYSPTGSGFSSCFILVTRMGDMFYIDSEGDIEPVIPGNWELSTFVRFFGKVTIEIESD